MRIRQIAGNRQLRGSTLMRSTAAVIALAALAGSGRAQAMPIAAARPGASSTGPGTISAVAGGVGGPAKATRVVINVSNVSFGDGNLYIAGGIVREVNPRTDRLTTPAGTGFSLPSGDGGAATRAGLIATATALDGAGNLVIADGGHGQIRVVAASTGTFYGRAMVRGRIYRVAGSRRSGYSGDGGPATSARLKSPGGVAADGAGNLVIADTGNNRIRVVAASTGTFYGTAMTAGDIYTVAGNGTPGFTGDGGPATSAELDFANGVALDGAGNLVIADTGNDRIRVVAASTGTFYGTAMTAGDIYTVAGNGTPGFTGDGGPATSAELDGPKGATVDDAGNLVIADTGNNRIRVVADRSGTFYRQTMSAGDIYTVAGNGTPGFTGDGGPATSAQLNTPGNATVDSAGNLVIADSFNSRVRVLAAASGTFYGRSMTAGDIYTVAGRTGRGLSCCPGAPAVAAQLPGLRAVAMDHSGNLLIGADTEVEVAAAASGTFYGQPMTAGDLYVIAGNGMFGGSGDGGPATSARLHEPDGLAVDGAGNVIIADQQEQRVRIVAAVNGTFYGQLMTAGHIYTVAGNGTAGFSGDGGPATSAEISFPSAVAVDGAANLLIADSDNDRIRVVAASTGTFYGQPMTNGHIYTIAGNGSEGPSGDGGPATSAELDFPNGVALDGAGNVVIADTTNFRIRVVAASTGTFYGQPMTAGHIYTVAGNGSQGFSGDGGPATSAKLGSPSGVAVDQAGNLVFGDFFYSRIRVVAARNGTFYGTAMTAGDIYSIAGNGTFGGSGDGRPGTSAELGQPDAVAVTSAGNVVIADEDNQSEDFSRVRMVQG
jgi:hypothetical protein